MLNKTFLLFTLSCFTFQFGWSQDIRFTQFYNAPLTLNPALTGVMDDNHRINANYRSQRSDYLDGDAFSAYNITFDKKLIMRNGAALGIGIKGFADRTGELNSRTSQGHLSIAYHKRLYIDSTTMHTVSFAAEYGIVERTVDVLNARWCAQVDKGSSASYPSPDISSFGPSFVHADFGLGLYWQSKISSSFSFAVGGAIRHLNKANVNYFGAELTDVEGNVIKENLNSSFSIHAEAEWKLGDLTRLKPRFLYVQQGEFKETTYGLKSEFKIGKPTLGIGHYFRNNISYSSIDTRALTAVLSLDFNVFKFGLSYDISNDSINGSPHGPTAANKGGVELTTSFLF